jgi:hypothetical protein
MIFEAPVVKEAFENMSVYADRPALNYPLDVYERGIAIELQSAGIEVHDKFNIKGEDLDKASKKAKANLDKDPNHYINLMAGESAKVDKHDREEEIKRGEGKIDVFNGMKKADLKEAKVMLKEGKLDDLAAKLGVDVDKLKKAADKIRDMEREKAQQDAKKLAEVEKAMTNDVVEEAPEMSLEEKKLAIGAVVDIIKKKYPNISQDIALDFIKTHYNDLINGADPIAEFEEYVSVNTDYVDETTVKEEVDYHIELITPEVAFDVESGELADTPYAFATEDEIEDGEADVTTYTDGDELDEFVFGRSYEQAKHFEKTYPGLFKVVTKVSEKKVTELEDETDGRDIGGKIIEFADGKNLDVHVVYHRYKSKMFYDIPVEKAIDITDEYIDQNELTQADTGEKDYILMIDDGDASIDIKKADGKKWDSDEVMALVSEKKGKDHDGDGDVDGDDYMHAKDKAIKKAMGKEEQLKEAIKSIIKKTLKDSILNEAATNGLAALSDQYDNLKGFKTAVIDLQNLVTEIESFNDRMRDKIQGVFNKTGDIENEDGLKVGAFLAPTIMNAFKKDLGPVMKGGYMKSIELPKTSIFKQQEPAVQEQPKQTVFGINEEKK